MKKNTAVKFDKDNSGLNNASYIPIVGGVERTDIRINRITDPDNNGKVTVTTTSRLAEDGSLPLPLPTMDGLVRNVEPNVKVVRSVKGTRMFLRNYEVPK